MRKVKFNRYIEPEYTRCYWFRKLVTGTGVWETGFPNEGLFHQWACTYNELPSGPGNYTVALIELPDGKIEEVFPFEMKFVS